jgi:hypothetical protein
VQCGHRGTVRPALGTGRQLDLNSGVLLLPALIACAQTAAIDATGSGVGGVRVGWDPRPLRTGALLQSMLRWQVPTFVSFQRRASAARRLPAPARRPQRRPVPELTDSLRPHFRLYMSGPDTRRCHGFAVVSKAVQQHRMLGQAADAHSIHLSACMRQALHTHCCTMLIVC